MSRNRCPHCGRSHSERGSDTTYNCGASKRRHSGDNDENSAFRQMRVPGEGVYDAIDNTVGKLFGF